MNQTGMERRIYSHREMVAALGLVLLKQGGHREPTPPPAAPGPNLPARPAPATAAAVRRPAPGEGSLPARPRTPEGGWRSATSARQTSARRRRSGGNHRQQTGHHHHHHHPHQHQQQQQNHPASGSVMPYQHTTTTTTTTTAVHPPPPFPNLPPHIPPMGYGEQPAWQQPQQLHPRRPGLRGTQGREQLDEENTVPPPSRRAGNSRRW